MDFDAYAQRAVRLVNAGLTAPDELREFITDIGWSPERLTDRDLPSLRRAQRRLRHVFTLGTAGRDAEVVTELNALLTAHPVQPRISGHDANDWHMHVTGRGSSISAEYLAGAVWGLAVWVCRYGSARFGSCADTTRCGNV